MKTLPDIIRSEFIGTKTIVVRGEASSCVGLSGKIIDETRSTVVILQNGERKRIVKNSVVFHFEFCDGAVYEINGRLLLGRPEDRVKRRIRRLW